MTKKVAFEVAKFWVCEKCGHVHESGLDGLPADPPDECDYCGYEFLDNLKDLMAQGWPCVRRTDC